MQVWPQSLATQQQRSAVSNFENPVQRQGEDEQHQTHHPQTHQHSEISHPVNYQSLHEQPDSLRISVQNVSHTHSVCSSQLARAAAS